MEVGWRWGESEAEGGSTGEVGGAGPSIVPLGPNMDVGTLLLEKTNTASSPSSKLISGCLENLPKCLHMLHQASHCPLPTSGVEPPLQAAHLGSWRHIFEGGTPPPTPLTHRLQHNLQDALLGQLVVEHAAKTGPR